MINKLKTLAVIASAFAIMFSCSKNQAEEIEPETDPSIVTVNNVTYTNFTGALLQAKCNGCHGATGYAKSFWLFNGSASAAQSNARNSMLVTKTMPKNSSLTPKEIELLTAWYNRGLPQ